MNAFDRAMYRFLVAIPWRVHRRFPRLLKRILNRWMKRRGDPGDRD